MIRDQGKVFNVLLRDDSRHVKWYPMLVHIRDLRVRLILLHEPTELRSPVEKWNRSEIMGIAPFQAIVHSAQYLFERIAI